MADLVAGDVTYTLKAQSISNLSIKSVVASMAFGDGSKTYPSGGIPLTIGNLGLPNSVQSMEFIDLGTSGYVFSFDTTNTKLRMFQRDAHNHPLFLKNAAVADGATARVNAAASNLLGANTGADITVVGSNGATTGGVATNAAGALTELVGGTTAPAALTIVVRAQGF